ncbi:MAG: DMT family transporter [Clostridiales bacterium]|jgi:drug/metabolite transporter (DMT)-like permease|nr:DMT family transporter [Clostridiales bacterium]
MKRQRALGSLSLIVATLIWGSTFVLMKDTVESIPTFYLLAIRFTSAAVLLAAFGFKSLKKLNLKYIINGVILGVLLLAAYVFQTFGLKVSTPGKNAFLTTVYCIIVPFLYWAISGRRPDRYNISAAILCLAGIGLLSLERDLSVNYGDCLTLVGGFFFACHIVALAKATDECAVLPVTMLQFLTAGLVSFVCGMIFEKFPEQIPNSALLSLAYLTVFATAGSLLLQSIGQKYTHPSTAAVLLTLESVFGAAISIALGRDQPSLRLFSGFVIIFLAVLISETKPGFSRLGRASVKIK